MKRLHCLFAVLTLSLLTACLEFDEVTQLKPDGSVDFTLSIQLPDLPDKKQDNEKQKETQRDIEEVFQKLSGAVQLKGKEEKTEYGKTTFTISASMDSLARIGQMYQALGKSDSQQEKKDGKEIFDELFSQQASYRVQKTKRNSLLISRSFSPPKKAKAKPAKQGKDTEAFSKDMEGIMLNAMTFQFEFFSPTEILSSNATQRFGNNLRWDVSLGYLSEKPFKMEIEIASTPELEAALSKTGSSGR